MSWTTRAKVATTAAAVLLGATGATMAQDAGQPVFSLNGSGGLTVLNVPTFDPGVFGHTAGGTLVGGMIGGNFTAKIGKAADFDLLMSVNAFGSFGGGGSSWADTLTNAQSPVVITGLSTPGGSSAITLDPTAASASVTGAGGATANTTATLSPTNNVAAVTPDGTGFAMSSVVTNGTAGATYGGIGSSSGGIFIGSGNIAGTTIKTDVYRSFLYGGADWTLGLGGQASSNVGVQIYGGPSVRGLYQGTKTDVTADIAEAQPSVLTHPTYTLSISDQLTSTYLGGVLGTNLSIATESGIVYTLGVEGGIYSVHSAWRGQDTYSTCCGAVGTPLGTPSPNISVQGPAFNTDLGSQIAFAARGNVGATWAIAQNKTFTLGGNVEYLSKVATVNHSGVVKTNAASDDYTVGSQSPATTTFGWASMINFGITGTLTGHF